MFCGMRVRRLWEMGENKVVGADEEMFPYLSL